MGWIQKTIEVDLPVSVAYHRWTRFEDFPKFMTGVGSVCRIDANRLRWRAEALGRHAEWVAEVLEMIPNRRISWRSTSDAHNAGSISFDEVGDRRTRLTLRIDANAESAAEIVASALGQLSARIEGDLLRFKRLSETVPARN